MKGIDIKNLTKKYKNRTAVDTLNLTIKEGEFFALLGTNGAGKTTTIKMLSCLLEPTSGDAQLLGNSIDRKSTRLNSSHVAISYAVFCLKKYRMSRVTME